LIQGLIYAFYNIWIQLKLLIKIELQLQNKETQNKKN